MNDSNFAPLALSVLSVLVSIAAFVLGDPEKNKTWRIALGITFLFLAIVLGTYGVVVLMLPSDQVPPVAELNTLVVESPKMRSDTPQGMTQIPNTPEPGPTHFPPTITPTPMPISMGTLIISGNASEGVRFDAPLAGVYSFRYIGGAYSTYQLGKSPEGIDSWLTAVRVFRNEPVQWKADGVSLSDQSNVRLADFGYQSSSSVAESAASDSVTRINLDSGEYLTLVAVDGQPYYSDNPGQVIFEVSFAGIAPTATETQRTPESYGSASEVPTTPEEAAQKWGGSPAWWRKIEVNGWKLEAQLTVPVGADWRIDFVAPDGRISACDNTQAPGVYGPATVDVTVATLWYVPGETKCPPFTAWGKANP